MARRTRTNAGTPRVTVTAALCAVAVLAGVAACGAAGAGQGGSQAAQPSAHGSEAAVLRQFVDCVRSHGVPGFPDGSIDSHGVVSFPDSAPRLPDSAVTACQTIYNRLPPQPNASSAPVPQQVFQELLSFARCMRAHGVSDWPDPAPNGTFFLDSRLIAAGKRGFIRQVQGCEQANPGVSGHFSVAQGS